MDRPFADRAVLERMLIDRANGWSLASLMQKYNIKSHRSIVYQAKKHSIKTIKPRVYYHAVPTEISFTIRSAVRDFPLRQVRSQTVKPNNSQIIEKVSWWIVENYTRENHINKPMFSFIL